MYGVSKVSHFEMSCTCEIKNLHRLIVHDKKMAIYLQRYVFLQSNPWRLRSSNVFLFTTFPEESSNSSCIKHRTNFSVNQMSSTCRARVKMNARFGNLANLTSTSGSHRSLAFTSFSFSHTA